MFVHLRLEALDHLIASNQPGIVERYVAALRDTDNVVVNRAAAALKTINAAAAISPLIDALVTDHKYKVKTGEAGQLSATFSPQTGGGFSFGSSGPRTVKRAQNNPEVLSALIALSGGANFEYDKTAWRQWFAAQRGPQDLDARRDP